MTEKEDGGGGPWAWLNKAAVESSLPTPLPLLSSHAMRHQGVGGVSGGGDVDVPPPPPIHPSPAVRHKEGGTGKVCGDEDVGWGGVGVLVELAEASLQNVAALQVTCGPLPD